MIETTKIIAGDETGWSEGLLEHDNLSRFNNVQAEFYFEYHKYLKDIFKAKKQVSDYVPNFAAMGFRW